MHKKKSSFYNHLVKAKIIDNHTWNLAKFDTLQNHFTYSLKQKKIAVSTTYTYLEKENTENFILKFKDGKHTIAQDTLTFEFPPQVIFSTMDLNENGTDELYALYQYYAINGDNYELSIYELK